MTTGISTEFNILAWEISFAHPKWLSLLNISAQSDVRYINKTTQTACLSISKKGSTPAIPAHILCKHWFPADKCNQGLYAHRSQQDGIVSLERSEENCN